ncbi:hypothetical protein D3C83_81060 [compost metagenome]
MRHIGRGVSRRNEIELGRIVRGVLAMDGVEQSVLGEVGMQVEADETALEAIVDRQRKLIARV